MKDLIIVGAGPAGLSAALNAAHLKLDTLVIEAKMAGGLPMQNYPWKEIDSYLGMCKMTGHNLAKKMVEQVPKTIDIHENEQVIEISKLKAGFKVKTTKATYTAKTIIIAIGIMGQPRRIGIEGENLEGVDTEIKSPAKFKGKKVAVIGGGDTAVEYAISLSQAGADVRLIHRRDALRATGAKAKELANTNVHVMFNCEVGKIHGTRHVEKIDCSNNKTGEKQTFEVDQVFECIGNMPSRDFLEKTGIKMEKIHPETKPNFETNITGLYVAGDITGKLMKISEAVAEGNRALLSAYSFLKSPYWAENGK